MPAKLEPFDPLCLQVKRQICVTKIRQLAQDACLSTQQFVAMDAVIQST